MENDPPLYQLRMYTPEDYPMIAAWCDWHDRDRIPEGILPRLGVIVQADGEDCAALWLYMDNSVGVCFLEFPVTRPGLSARQAGDALLMAIEFLKREAHTTGYGIMFTHALKPMARFLTRNGWRKCDENPWTKMAILTGGDTWERE